MDTNTVLSWLGQSGLRILLIIVVALISYRLLGILTRYLSNQIKDFDDVDGSELDKRTTTIFSVIRNAGVVLIVGTAVLMILSELGVSVTPVLASVGVAGLALGLGAQTLVKDVISGLFILLENQYTVGDTVNIGGQVGTVEKMTLRATLVRDLYGTIHTIPNGDIRIVSNMSRDWSRAIVDVRVRYDADVDAALDLLQEIGDEISDDEEYGSVLQERLAVTGVEGLEDWAIRLRIMAKTEPGEQWGLQRQLRRLIHQEFEQKGIDFAFPRQDMLALHEKVRD